MSQRSDALDELGKLDGPLIGSEMSCMSCLHSKRQWNDALLELICVKTGDPAADPCGSFVYEPGTDAGE